MTALTVLTTVALTLAIALFGMVTRLIVPLARAVWREQTASAAAQITVLAALPLPARHARRRFRRAA